MRRGTTPTNTFSVSIDLTEATVFVTYAQDGKIILEKTGSDLQITATAIRVTLSQEDTLKLHEGRVDIQIRYVTELGAADASNIISTTAERILKDGVIEYVSS